jgi:carboxyl-terminal processing protease
MTLRDALSRAGAFAGAVALTLSASLAIAQEKTLKPEAKEQVVQKVTDILTKSAYVPGIDFAKWPEFLAAEKERVDAATTEEELQRAINAAIAKFGASHIVLSSPKMAEQRRTQRTVGVGITTQPIEEGLIIIRTIKGASAETAGLVAGDIITAVDGKPVDGIKGIPGEEGTSVRLTVKHSSGNSKDYDLVRKPFSTKRPEELTWLDKDTAKLSVYTFDFSYDRENVEKLMTEALRSRNLILDLRDNGGGAVMHLEHLLGMLLPPDKPIGTFVSRSLVKRYQEETGSEPTDLAKIAAWSEDKIHPRLNRRVPRYKGNIVVLVNQFSGSASEIAAAALRDNVGAKVVGTKSAGAVLVSIIVPATNGFMLQYPLMDYITVSGLRLEGNGVTPDVEATDPKIRLASAKDEVVDKARELFLTAKTRDSGSR